MSLTRLNDDLPRHGARVFGLTSDAKPVDGEGAATKALDALSKFIPTEMLAPYVAVLAYAADRGAPSASIYWWFVGLTPLVSFFFQYARSALEDSPWPARGPTIWRSVAATVAFAVWGLAPPGSAFQAEVGGPALAGVAAVIVSPLLTGADAIVLRLMGVRRVRT